MFNYNYKPRVENVEQSLYKFAHMQNANCKLIFYKAMSYLCCLCSHIPRAQKYI